DPGSCLRDMALPAAEGGVGGLDDAAAEAGFALVEHHRLAGSDRALGRGESHFAAATGEAYGTGLCGLAVACLGGAGERVARCAAVHPGEVAGDQARGLQPAVAAALGDVEEVFGHVLADHVPRLAAGAGATADAEPAALTEGVVHDAVVLADPGTFRRAHFAGPGRNVVRQEVVEVAFADEADAGGVLLGVRAQAGVPGQPPDLGLLQLAHGEQRGAQGLLAQGVQEVTLVLVGVVPAQETPAAV